MDEKIIATYCLCDDLLKAMHHQEIRKCCLRFYFGTSGRAFGFRELCVRDGPYPILENRGYDDQRYRPYGYKPQ